MGAYLRLPIDLEATCWKGMVTPGGLRQSVDTMKIFEVGCAVAIESGELLDGGSFIIRPTAMSELSTFCISLTSITQEIVDAAKTLSMTAKDIYDFIAQFNDLAG